MYKKFQARFQELVDELMIKNKTEAAKKIGVTYATFSKCYNYGIPPKPSVLIRLADAFDVSILYLLGKTDDEYFDKSENPITFQERLNELLKEKGLKIYALSTIVHIHRNNMSQWMKKNYIPALDDLILVADFFEVSLDYLLGRTEVR